MDLKYRIMDVLFSIGAVGFVIVDYFTTRIMVGSGVASEKNKIVRHVIEIYGFEAFAIMKLALLTFIFLYIVLLRSIDRERVPLFRRYTISTFHAEAFMVILLFVIGVSISIHNLYLFHIAFF